VALLAALPQRLRHALLTLRGGGPVQACAQPPLRVVAPRLTSTRTLSLAHRKGLCFHRVPAWSNATTQVVRPQCRVHECRHYALFWRTQYLWRTFEMPNQTVHDQVFRSGCDQRPFALGGPPSFESCAHSVSLGMVLYAPQMYVIPINSRVRAEHHESARSLFLTSCRNCYPARQMFSPSMYVHPIPVAFFQPRRLPLCCVAWCQAHGVNMCRQGLECHRRSHAYYTRRASVERRVHRLPVRPNVTKPPMHVQFDGLVSYFRRFSLCI